MVQSCHPPWSVCVMVKTSYFVSSNKLSWTRPKVWENQYSCTNQVELHWPLTKPLISRWPLTKLDWTTLTRLTRPWLANWFFFFMQGLLVMMVEHNGDNDERSPNLSNKGTMKTRESAWREKWETSRDLLKIVRVLPTSRRTSRPQLFDGEESE